MLKILITFFILLSGFINSNVNAEEDLRIISREEWGANEEYRYQDSKYWKNIFINRNKASVSWAKKWANFSQEKKDRISAKNKIKADKRKKMNAYLLKNFSKYLKVAEYKKFD